MQTSLHSLFSMPPRNFSSSSPRRSSQWSERVALAEAANVCSFPTQEKGRSDLDGTAVSYRHDWGSLDTSANLFLEWDGVSSSSRVFVSITEGSTEGYGFGKAMGGSRCSLTEVAPKDGGVGIRVNVEGDRPIRLVASYLVINA
jgi:hypothetical protein